MPAEDLYRALELYPADFLRLDMPAENRALARVAPRTAALPPGSRVLSTSTESADPGYLTVEGAETLQQLLDADPQGLLAIARRGVDSTLDENELRRGIGEARHALKNPDEAAAALTALRKLESRGELPANFTFPGMDLQAIPIDFESTKFEKSDLKGWIIRCGPGWVRRHVSNAGLYKFRWHNDPQYARFMYEMDDAQPIALFSDFGTHLYQSRYIAKAIANGGFRYAFHLGDVYYAGTRSEFQHRFINDLAPILPTTELFTLAGNHEMYAGGQPFIEYIDSRRTHPPGVPQRQEASYFCATGQRVQFIGVDTEYYGESRLTNDSLRSWLREQLQRGRREQRTNILLSTDEPYAYGRTNVGAIFHDIKNIIDDDLIDLWFWGNTHYCALFDRSTAAPFIGSCIGHGGLPYERSSSGAPTPAHIRFLETKPRFPEWTTVRQDRGNNGYCSMGVRADGITLTYIDWMTNIRCDALLDRSQDGRLRINSVHERS